MKVYFNPRSPRGERQVSSVALDLLVLFQSTLSARRATRSYSLSTTNCSVFQSTLSARRATFVKQLLKHLRLLFQSTLSARRATVSGSLNFHHTIISIHALREESDDDGFRLIFCRLLFQSTLSARRATLRYRNLFWGTSDFNPRSPRGERLACGSSKTQPQAFQSTLSARRATFRQIRLKHLCFHFNPRSPRGERQCM